MGAGPVGIVPPITRGVRARRRHDDAGAPGRADFELAGVAHVTPPPPAVRSASFQASSQPGCSVSRWAIRSVSDPPIFCLHVTQRGFMNGDGGQSNMKVRPCREVIGGRGIGWSDQAAIANSRGGNLILPLS